MQIAHTLELLVRKDQLSTTTLRPAPLGPLAEGRVRVVIDQFAFTSNNITYAAMGDAMQYWQFYPVADTDDGISWGRIPVWGFGTVQASRHADIAVGERLYGYFPMSSAVDLAPADVSTGAFLDAAPHRAALHRVYNQYLRCAADPFYTSGTEDMQALLRPLFTTSWLIDDFLADNDFFGAAAHGAHEAKPVLLLSSASSKTAYGTAFQLSQRAGVEVVGLTSAQNVAFCTSLGCYDRVLPYGELSAIDADVPSIYIDFAGNAPLRKAIHTHCKGLHYSCSIGATHVSDIGGAKDIPGPKATLFFAPAQIKKRNQEWGGAVLGQRLVHAWQAFVAQVSQPELPWLRVAHATGPAAVQAVYLEVLGGKGDPRLGHVLSLSA
jgi:hypothetical protein